MDYEQLPSLPMGVKFRPNQQELLLYLKHKLAGEPLGNDPIADVDVYDSEPWDLPSKSKLKKEVRKWYFYTRLQKKSEKKSLRTNRETNKGQWRPTGNDRKVCYNSRTLRFSGTKKILSFHSREDGKWARTNWGMHQYSLGDKESHGNSLVLCEIFLKPYDESTGGEAPSGEASREHDDVAAVAPAPGETAPTGVVVDDGRYVEAANLSQDVNHSGVFIEDYQLPIGGTSETSELHPNPKFIHIPEQHGMDAEPWTNGFIEAHDLATPMEADSACVGPADNPDFYFHPSEFLGPEDSRPHDSQVDVNHSGVFIEDYQLPIGGTSKTSELHPDPKFVHILEQHRMDAVPWTDGFIEEHNLVTPMEAESACIGPHDSQKDVDSWVFVEDYQQPKVGTGQASELHPDEKNVHDQEQYGMVAKPLKDKYFVESSDCTNAFDNPPSNDEFIEDEDPVYVDLADNPDMLLDLSEIFGTEITGSSVALENEIEGADQMSEEDRSAFFNISDFLNLDGCSDMDLSLSEISGTENVRPPAPQQNEIVGANQVSEAKMGESGGKRHKHA